MALRTLVFTSDQQIAQVLARHLAEFDLEAILCSNIFAAVESASRIRVDGVIADWNDDPEATFLLRRLRETDLNRKAMVLAIVKDEAEVARAYDAGAKAVLFRPLDGGEIREALTKARPFMLERSTGDEPQGTPPSHLTTPVPERQEASENEVMPIASPMAQVFTGGVQAEPPSFDHESIPTGKRGISIRFPRISWQLLAAVVLLAATPFAIRFGGSLKPLRAVMRHVADATFGSAEKPPQRPPLDESLDRSTVPTTPSGNVRVVASVNVLYIAVARLPLQKESLPDFPLQAERPNIPPRKTVRAAIPDSIRRSAPIETGHPLEVRATPVVSDIAEPVSISEQSARQLLLHSVDPAYPEEAVHARIQGAVVLQALIARDGSVRDLRLIDGYFVLGRAAVQAVKQWHFRPYVINGRAVESQTLLTFNFRLPVVSGVPKGNSLQ